jgi:1-acyl-sn-glycerol-3-phosphate acyltransferase
MITMINKIITVIFITFIGVTSALFFIISLLIWAFTNLFDKRLVLLHLFSSFWASFYLWCLPAWSVTINGRKKMDRKKRYIIVSNHQSQLDILVAFGLFFPFKWVSKAEVFKLPFIGWNMKLNKYIGLKRGHKNSIKQMLAACKKALEQGCSVYFFPEGTRSQTGQLKKFMPGAFLLAKRMKLPILPIAINGTMAALPKHTLSFTGKHEMSLTVLDEIPYEKFAHLSLEEIANMVRDIIAEHVD